MKNSKITICCLIVIAIIMLLITSSVGLQVQQYNKTQNIKIKKANSEPQYPFSAECTEKSQAIPAICCEGELVWVNVIAGARVYGTFQVCNCGEPGSLLNWDVNSFPIWGIWTFTPCTGTGLAEGDCVTITVEVIAPPVKNETFTGTIKMINIDDPTDFCEVEVSLTTLSESKICCNGRLVWKYVKPGAIVNATFQLCNCGETGSLLNWNVDTSTLPNWMEYWEFTPSSGTGLAEGDCVNITVQVVAPPEKKKTFTGKIKIMNSDNTSDFCEIDVSLTTPRARTINGFNLIFWILQKYPNMFPMLQHLLRI